MGEPIENLYFNWLCAKVLDGGGGSSYIDLLVILHRTEFVWVVPADRHRISEGKDLRDNFLTESRMEEDPQWEMEPCSVLEMLVAFCNRLSFQTGAPPKSWFWELMTNLELNEYVRVSNRDQKVIDDILYSFIWRQYDPDGRGGLFPLGRTQNDQRKIEVWYQFAEYATERGLY